MHEKKITKCQGSLHIGVCLETYASLKEEIIPSPHFNIKISKKNVRKNYRDACWFPGCSGPMPHFILHNQYLVNYPGFK